MPGETAPEASFPSSHTMLIMTVMIAVMIVSDKYFGDLLGAFVRVLCFLTVLVTVGGRLWCGVHWFTDIIGGILLSATLLFLFQLLFLAEEKRKQILLWNLHTTTNRQRSVKMLLRSQREVTNLSIEECTIIWSNDERYHI